MRRPALRRGGVGLASVFAESRRLYVERFRFLSIAGLAVFIPVGLVEALQLDLSDLASTVAVVGTLLTATLFTVVALLGEVLYSGIVAATVRADRSGRTRPVGEIVRSLPYGRLIAADLVFVAVVVVGLIVFIVPGLVFLAWFALAAAIIEVERVGLADAFRRSRELVRRDFWRAFAIVVVATLGSSAIASGLSAAAAGLLGHSLVARWIEAIVSETITAPLFALPIVVLYFELAELDAPAATSSGTVTNR